MLIVFAACESPAEIDSLPSEGFSAKTIKGMCIPQNGKTIVTLRMESLELLSQVIQRNARDRN